MDECPIGAAALAGTGFPIDRDMTAKELGFREPTRNSIDTVSDRDFALEFLSLASICAVHLSRLAEEIVIWSTPQFGLFAFPTPFPPARRSCRRRRIPMRPNWSAPRPAASTVRWWPSDHHEGSAAGLFEGHAGRQGTGLRRGIQPRAVNGSHDRHGRDMEVRTDQMRKAAGSGYSTATDLADWLVREVGLPFREAHHVTGRAVALAESRSADLDDLSLEDLQPSTRQSPMRCFRC
jgi:argininosuccinate lyase